VLVQDVHRVVAVLAGAVDAASDVEAVLGDVVAGEAPEIVCWSSAGGASMSAGMAVRTP
jgi:hypothetical protein